MHIAMVVITIPLAIMSIRHLTIITFIILAFALVDMTRVITFSIVFHTNTVAITNLT